MVRRSDREWVRGMFGLSPYTKDTRNLSARQDSSSDLKFADTSLGGNAALNAPYQYTRFADISSGGLFATTEYRQKPNKAFENDQNSGSFRMGRVYSETHDDHAQLLHMRFGIPKFTGSFTFFANMHDRDLARLAKYGEYTLAYRAGQVTGLFVMFCVVPLAITIPLIITSRTLRWLLKKNPSRYYYLKPTPNLYLQSVQAILDSQLMLWRLVPYTEFFGTDHVKDASEAGNNNTETVKQAHAILPDIWKAEGKFDVYKMINRYQVLANYQANTLQEIAANASANNFQAAVKTYLQNARNSEVMKNAMTDLDKGLYDLAQRYSENKQYQMDPTKDAADEAHWKQVRAEFEADGASAANITKEQEAGTKPASGADGEKTEPGVVAKVMETFESFWDGLWSNDAMEQLGAELKGGGQWISFKVNAHDTITDTFSNSTKTPEIASAINSAVASARTLDFSTSGGTTGVGVLDSVTSTIKEFLDGALDSVALTGLLSVVSGYYVDIPEVWDSSSASVGDVSYSLQLRSPYGNDMSLFQDIIVPMSFLLAGALPLAAGKQTHGQPFLVEAYSRGRQTTRLGIITNLTFTRGVGNMGWRADGRPMAVDVSFTIKDLSTVMTMPLVRDPGIFDDDNKYTDYMATLGSATLNDMTLLMNKTTLKVNNWKQSWKSRFMSGRIVSDVSSGWLAGIASNLSAAGALGSR